MWFVLLINLVVVSVSAEFSTVSLVPRLDITLPFAPLDGFCRRDAKILGQGLDHHSLWAMRMWDASAQGASGALFGNNWHMGDFDECLEYSGPFKTKYCLLVVQTNITRNGREDDVVHYIQETIDDRRWLRRDTEHVAICVPQQCSTEDLSLALTAQVNKDYNGSGVSYAITIAPDMCTESLETPPWSVNEICFGILLSTFVVGVLLAFFIKDSTKSRLAEIIRCFSAQKNVAKLFGPGNTNESKFNVFHGVKVISMGIIVIGHRGSLPIGGAVSNYQHVEDIQQGINSMLFSHADLVVDTFIFISGVLATHFMCKLWAKGKLNLLQAAVARIIRIAPVYYLLVWFQASIAHRVGSGPLWNMVQKTETEACQNTWWANLLFINNYFPASQMCLLHTWYLGCDMHFFLLTLLLTPLLVKRPTVAKWLMGALILLTSVIPAVIVTLDSSIEPILIYFEDFHKNPRAHSHLTYLYNPSHTRITVYLIGMATGFYFWLKEDCKYLLSKVLTVIGAFFGILLLWTPMALGADYYTKKIFPSVFYSVFYIIIRRPTFAMGLVILLLVHRFSSKDYFSWFSSNQIILVLSRLTFTIYLVHFTYILYDWARIRTPVTFTLFDMVTHGLSDMMFAAVVAGVIFVTIELPVKRIFHEIIFSKRPDLTPTILPLHSIEKL